MKYCSVLPTPAFAGVNLSPRKRGVGIQTGLDSRLRGNDGYVGFQLNHR